jgi:hypothetical protein
MMCALGICAATNANNRERDSLFRPTGKTAKAAACFARRVKSAAQK